MTVSKAMLSELYQAKTSDRVSGLTVPLLLLVGSRDLVVPPSSLRDGYAKWGGPKSFVEMAESHHLPFVDEPARFVTLVQQFMQGKRANTRSPAGASTTDRAREQRSVRSARLAQNKAIAAGDVDRVADFWTEDVEIRRGLGQLVLGREAYRQLFVATASRDSGLIYQREPTSIDVSAHWPLAYESGTWAGHLGRVDGPIVIRGQYAAQWVKREGRWLIRGEVFVALACAGIGCTYEAAP